MPLNFTLQDLAGTARATVAFGAILFCPGYLLTQLDVPLEFARRSRAARAAWAVGLSFALSPLLLYFLASVTSITTSAAIFGVLAGIAAFVAWRTRESFTLPRDPSTRLLLALLLAAAAFTWFELVDLQVGNRLYLSVTALDQAYRVAFTDAVARTGVPPANPLYWPGHAAPLRYYYFWYALCATAMKLGHASARQALMASSIWSGIGLTALIALFARHFLRLRHSLRQYVLTAVLLLSVTGLDLLPVLANFATGDPFRGDLEWWSTDQVTSWLDTILWVPNHLAALVCCLVAFLALWLLLAAARPTRQRIALLTLAAVAASSVLGLSVYLAAGLMLLIACWTLRRVFTRQTFAPILLAGSVAALLSLPFLRELTAGPHTAGPSPLGFGIRRMIDSALLTGIPALAKINQAHPILLDQAVRLLLLIPGYFVELGFFGVALVWFWRRRRTCDEPHRTALFLAISGLVIVSFVRSTVISNNDFGYRAALLPCFFLLLLGAELLTRLKLQSRAIRIAVWITVAIGHSATLFQAAALRLYVPLEARRHQPQFEGLPQLSFAQRNAFEGIQSRLPPSSHVQFNPSGDGDYLALGNLLYAHRQFLLDAATDCGTPFGGDPAPCPQLRQRVLALYAEPASAGEAQQTCAALGIDTLIATSRDPVWQDPQSWVWTLPPVAPENPTDSVRIVHCPRP